MIEYSEVTDLKRALKQKEEENRKQKIIIGNLKKQNIEALKSLHDILGDLIDIGHSIDSNKNIKMMNILAKTYTDLDEDLKIDLFVPNDEEGKIIELNVPEQYA